MDFWCWRGRAAETAAEAEAVEARDPGMVRLGDKSSGEAWIKGEVRVWVRKQGQGQGESCSLSGCRTGPGSGSRPVRAKEKPLEVEGGVSKQSGRSGSGKRKRKLRGS